MNDWATLQAALQPFGLALPSPAFLLGAVLFGGVGMWAIGLALCAGLVWARE